MTIQDQMTTQEVMKQIQKLHKKHQIKTAVFTKISASMEIGALTLQHYANDRLVGRPQRPTALMLLSCLETEIANGLD